MSCNLLYFVKNLKLTWTSIQVSAALCQNTPQDCCAECDSITGIDPYSAIGLSNSYSKTSKLYKR